jgi:MFS family permease
MATDRKLLPESWREFARLMVIASGAGVAISALLWLPQRQDPLLTAVMVGALVGACIYLATLGLAWIFRRGLGRLEGAAASLAIGAIFFVAGVVGWTLAAVIAFWIAHGTVGGGPAEWRSTLLIAGGLGLGVGIGIFTYESLRHRLSESIARLKETEYAERELATARDIQRRLLPPAAHTATGLAVAARIEPAGFVAGDFYDYFRLADGRLVLVVGDVAGKGMGASLLMASTKAMLVFVAAERGAGAILTALNERLVPTLGSREFVALAVALFDPLSGRFELANGGLPDPYVLSPERLPRGLSVSGPRLPLGLKLGVAYETLEDTLDPGDRLLFVTDGLPEAPRSSGGEPLGYAAFEALLAGLEGDPAAAVAHVFAAVDALTVKTRADDWTALLLERAG